MRRSVQAHHNLSGRILQDYVLIQSKNSTVKIKLRANNFGTKSGYVRFQQGLSSTVVSTWKQSRTTLSCNIYLKERLNICITGKLTTSQYCVSSSRRAGSTAQKISLYSQHSGMSALREIRRPATCCKTFDALRISMLTLFNNQQS